MQTRRSRHGTGRARGTRLGALAPALTLAVAGAAVAGCGSGPARQSSRTSAPATSTPSTTAPAKATTTTVAGPAGGPVPAGFEPLAFTAVSDLRYWVLGRAPCGSATCAAIVRTTDGGRSFAAIPAPPVASGTESALRFADQRDGYAYSVDTSGTAFYATHDGGASWRSVDVGPVLGFDTSAGTAYVVTAQCGGSGCSGFRLERSAAGSDSWDSAPLAFAPDGPGIALLARGTHVWIQGSPAVADGPHDEALARSTDGGRTFTVGTGPCIPGLGGGHLAAVSASELWALCPTGMHAAASRSTDGGVSWADLAAPPLYNAAVLGPASAGVAVLAPNDTAGELLRTTDGGGSWSPARAPAGAGYISWIGFTDATTGTALLQAGTQGAGATSEVMWRSTDGGADWTPVAFG